MRLLIKGRRKGAPSYFLTNKKTDSVFPVFEGDKYAPAKTEKHFEIVRKIHDSTKDPVKKSAHRAYLDKHQGSQSSAGHGLVVKRNSDKSFRVTGNVKEHAEALRALRGKSGHPYGSEQKNGDFIFSEKRRAAVERLLERLGVSERATSVRETWRGTPAAPTTDRKAKPNENAASAATPESPPAVTRQERVRLAEKEADRAVTSEAATKASGGALHKEAVEQFAAYESQWRRLEAVLEDWDADKEGYRRVSGGWEAVLPGASKGHGTYQTKAAAVEASKRYTEGLVKTSRKQADMHRGIVRMLASNKAPHEMSVEEFRSLWPGEDVLYSPVVGRYMAEQYGLDEHRRGSGDLVDNRVQYHGVASRIRARGKDRANLDDLHAAAVLGALREGKRVPPSATAGHPHIEQAARPLHELSLAEAALAHDAPGRDEGAGSDLYRMFRESHMSAVEGHADTVTDARVQADYPHLFGAQTEQQKRAWDKYMAAKAERRSLFSVPRSKRDVAAIESNLASMQSAASEFGRAGGNREFLDKAPSMPAAEILKRHKAAERRGRTAQVKGRWRDELDARNDMYDLRRQFEHAKRIEHLHAERFGDTPSLPRKTALSKGAQMRILIKGRADTRGKPDAFITVGASEGKDADGKKVRNKGTVVPVWGMTPHPNKPGKLVATMKSGKVLHVDEDRHEQVKKKVAHSQAEAGGQMRLFAKPLRPASKEMAPRSRQAKSLAVAESKLKASGRFKSGWRKGANGSMYADNALERKWKNTLEVMPNGHMRFVDKNDAE